MATAESSPQSQDWITPAALVLHGGAALGVGAMLYFVVPRHKKILEDFAIELPSAAVMLITLSDWVVNYFYILVFPLAVLLALDAFVLSGFRTSASKLLWGLLVLLVPVIFIGYSMMVLAATQQDLVEQL